MLDAYRDLIDDLIGTPTAIKQNPPSDATASARLRALIAADTQALADLLRLTRENSPVLSAPPDPETAAGVVPLADPDLVPDVDPTSDPDALIAAFDTARGELVSLLMNLTLKGWEATGIDTDGAVISVADLVERHVELDETIRAELATGT